MGREFGAILAGTLEWKSEPHQAVNQQHKAHPYEHRASQLFSANLINAIVQLFQDNRRQDLSKSSKRKGPGE